MRNWLQHDMHEARLSLVGAYLFGSSIHPGLNPRDVDLVMIAAGNAGSEPWRRAIEYRDALKPRFDEMFRLPLSAMVVTPSEWAQLNGTIVRERVSIF